MAPSSNTPRARPTGASNARTLPWEPTLSRSPPASPPAKPPLRWGPGAPRGMDKVARARLRLSPPAPSSFSFSSPHPTLLTYISSRPPYHLLKTREAVAEKNSPPPSSSSFSSSSSGSILTAYNYRRRPREPTTTSVSD